MSIASLFNRFRPSVVESKDAPAKPSHAEVVPQSVRLSSQEVRAALGKNSFNSENDPTGTRAAEAIRSERSQRGSVIRDGLISDLENHQRNLQIQQARFGQLHSVATLHGMISDIQEKLHMSNDELVADEIAVQKAKESAEGGVLARREKSDRADEAIGNADSEEEAQALRDMYNNPGTTREDAKLKWTLHQANSERDQRKNDQVAAEAKVAERERDAGALKATNDLLRKKGVAYTTEDYQNILQAADKEDQGKLQSYFGLMQDAANEIAKNGADELTGSGSSYLQRGNEMFGKFDAVLKEVAKKQGTEFVEKTKDAEPATDSERMRDAISERLTIDVGKGVHINLLTSFEAIASAIVAKKPDLQYSIASLQSDLKRSIPAAARDSIVEFPTDSGHRDTLNQSCSSFANKVYDLAKQSGVDLSTF